MPAPSGTELPVVQVGGGRRRSGTRCRQPPTPRGLRPGSSSTASTPSARASWPRREVAGRSWSWPRSTGSLLAYRDRCADCGEPLRGGGALEGVLACPRCARRYYLPRAGRSLDDEQLQLAPVPLLRETAPSGSPSRRERAGANGAPATGNGDGRAPEGGSRLGAAPICPACAGSPSAPARAPAGAKLGSARHGRRARSAASSAATGCPRAPPPAPPRRAPDPLRVRDAAGRCAPATPSCGPPGAGSPGSTTSSCPTSSGRSFGSRSASPSSCAPASPSASSRIYPSPAGATESELDPALGGAAARTRCSSGLEPDAEALIVNRHRRPPAVRDRADRRVLPAGRDDQGELGGDLGRDRARARDHGVLRRAAGQEPAPEDGRRPIRMGEPPSATASGGGGRRRRPDPSLRVVSTSASIEHAAAPTLALHGRGRATLGREVYTVALTA